MPTAAKANPAFTRHVDALYSGKDATPALIESAEAAQAAVASPGVQAILQVLQAEISTIDRKLDGTAITHEEYIRLHGRRSAINAFAEAADALTERATKRRAAAQAEIDREQRAGESAPER